MSRVLVVDDEPQIRRALRTSLEAHGYEVLAVGTGEEAVVGAAESAPELLLLDLGLPDVDGLVMLRDAIERGLDVPTIVVTARTDPRDRAAAAALGVETYLTKPFAWADFLSAVRATTGRAGT